ncbi:MAG TPA: hypothetical protein PLI53_07005, partial [Geobacteraceae bacterium]|nr:hypothetical protein [Geobacteraceae bacterium]
FSMKAAGYFNGKPSTLASSPGFPDEHYLKKTGITESSKVKTYMRTATSIKTTAHQILQFFRCTATFFFSLCMIIPFPIRSICRQACPLS